MSTFVCDICGEDKYYKDLLYPLNLHTTDLNKESGELIARVFMCTKCFTDYQARISDAKFDIINIMIKEKLK